MIAIIDYGMGNLPSVAKAAQRLGCKVVVTDSPKVIKKATKIVFPGVGHFGKTVDELKKRKIFSLLKEKIKAKTPFLGICLGMQLLFETSQESPGKKGLGVIAGEVKLFKDKKLIVPHMGWNNVKISNYRSQISALASPKGTNLFKGVKDKSYFYFCHSYYCKPQDKKVAIGKTYYGVEFASAVNIDNIWGVQFHPEKSQTIGLTVFNNFLNL